MLGQLLGNVGKTLRSILPELIAAIWRLIVLLILFVIRFFRYLWELLRRLFGDEEEEANKRGRCDQVPEHVKRKPDPCLYSQFYLRAQGYSVTWDNPDIWITEPDGTPIVSSDLIADTDYIVHVKIHDASFDPALFTEVRCFYRPWSFNHPDRVPLEINPDGTEKVVLLNISPWSSEIAQFKWHTPDVDQAHYCIQAECSHPDDKNPNNNLGQENTNVRRIASSETVSTTAFLINNERQPQEFRIEVDRYVIPEGRATLKLKTGNIQLRKEQPFDSLHSAMLTYDITVRRLKNQKAQAPTFVRYAYTGWDGVRENNEVGNHPITTPWHVTVDGAAGEGGRNTIRLDPGEGRDVELTVAVPPDAPPGTRHAFNWFAFNSRGKPMGGVTLYVDVT